MTYVRPPSRPPSTEILDYYIGPDGPADDWHMSYRDGVWVCYINGAVPSLQKHTGTTADLARFSAAWKIYRSLCLTAVNPELATEKI